MVTRLSKYKIGDYALVLGLLGVAERMADRMIWFEPFREILDVDLDSLKMGQFSGFSVVRF